MPNKVQRSVMYGKYWKLLINTVIWLECSVSAIRRWRSLKIIVCCVQEAGVQAKSDGETVRKFKPGNEGLWRGELQKLLSVLKGAFVRSDQRAMKVKVGRPFKLLHWTRRKVMGTFTEAFIYLKIYPLSCHRYYSRFYHQYKLICI